LLDDELRLELEDELDGLLDDELDGLLDDELEDELRLDDEGVEEELDDGQHDDVTVGFTLMEKSPTQSQEIMPQPNWV
jgi:hypothetical protein